MECAIAAALGLMDADSCRTFLIRRLHPGGPCCPDCGISLVGRQGESFLAGGRVRCRDCGRWFTYRTGTPFQGSLASDQQLCLFALLCAAGCSIWTIAAACHVTEEAILALHRRLSEWRG